MSTVNLVLVCVPVQSLTDTVESIGLASFGNGLTVSDLVAGDAQYFIGSDINGKPVLGFVKIAEGAVVGTFTGSGGAYQQEAVIAPVTIKWDLVGGRPDDRR